MIAPAVLRGRYWRVLSPRRAGEPLSGEGAKRNGGRYNRPGSRALYFSETLETAVAEYQQELGARPGTFVIYDVASATVVDLIEPSILAELGMHPDDLRAPWKELAFVQRQDPPTWLLADRLSGIAQGLRVPSEQIRGGVNLVLWSWNEPGGAEVRALDPQDELPRSS